MSQKLIPVILCGSAGSRLWPVSRELHPKSFIRLSDNQSILQKAFLRGADLPDVAEILTVTNQLLLYKTKSEYSEVASKGLKKSYIVEPFGRNTAAAICMAAQRVKDKYGANALMLILPSDHLTLDQKVFSDAVAQAKSFASEGQLVTFGIQPNAPETGYGYIEADGYKVKSFVEKPELETAKKYLHSGNYFWNSGMFCFIAGNLIEEMARHSPDVWRAVHEYFKKTFELNKNNHEEMELESQSFAAVSDMSIDYAVMTKSANVSVVPCSIGWSDIGSWTAINELSESDDFGNTTKGATLLKTVRNCYIQNEGRLTAALGVGDLIIIDTEDALLVAHKNSVQDVKSLYLELKAEGNNIHKIHRTVSRPWGTYTVLEEGVGFKIKRLVVKPGQSLSLQIHQHRAEHWVVVSGSAHIINGETQAVIETNESTYIPAGQKHRLSNFGLMDLVLIEVQSGAYLGEDDITRIEDEYGRAEK